MRCIGNIIYSATDWTDSLGSYLQVYKRNKGKVFHKMYEYINCYYIDSNQITFKALWIYKARNVICEIYNNLYYNNSWCRVRCDAVT